MSRHTTPSDRDELTELVARLGRWLDEQDFTDCRHVYADDAVVQTPGGRAEGTGAILDQLRANTPAGEYTQHVSSDVSVTVDGDAADVRYNLIVYFFGAGSTLQRTVGARCTFGAKHTAEGWRFARAEIAPLWATSPATGTRHQTS